MPKLAAPLKHAMPRSLFWRAFLILVVPIAGLQLVLAGVILQRHYDGVTEQMAGAVAREINYAISIVERAETAEDARDELEEISRRFGIQMGLDEGGTVEPAALRAFYDVTGSAVVETLKARIGNPVALDFLARRKHVDARVLTEKGVLRALISRRMLNPSNPHLLIVWMTATALALTTVATFFLRNQVRPIRALAHAAAAFGRGRSLPFRPSGAAEVRRAGQVFLEMRARIERQLEQRGRMLSAVSHDLKTPLTRMKLALAVAPEGPETAELARDVAEMEAMVTSFLDYAQGQWGEEAVPVDPVALAEEVVRDTGRAGQSLTLAAPEGAKPGPAIEMRRGAIKRCLSNLVGNALAYGTTARLSVRQTVNSVVFSVEDDGPGIPESRREEVLRPFVRLDPARNQDLAAGVGLGLAIALDIARSHGGGLDLDESPTLGGLRATLRIPR